ncbi:MAG: hypothetical protein REI96_10950 [Flavobacterium nitrogenifigens]|uniref:RNA polymerase sigma factor n=1 Tax=Flavobacterium nitrogenifigens TaxID=1617283 RepID=UPI0028069DE2|nr:hypothetical protein [Flavobacterium nitrogenifigens]MDQ8012958.1 hypothetical protein [Flavobacterium nitrogenifigens]
MTTQKQLTKLEQLQQQHNGIRFIRSYPILNYIKTLSPTDRQLIELVLSYQDNGQPFQMKYETIADILNISYQTVKNRVTKLSKENIIITNHKSNFNGVDGGSSTKLSVDLDVLITMIETPAESKPASTTEHTQKPETILVAEFEQPITAEIKEPTKKPEEVKKVQTDPKKALMLERYKSKFYYSKAGDTMTPADFHSLTDRRFMDLPKVTSRVIGLPADNFDVFWSKVQELKKDLLVTEQAHQ